MAEHGELAQRVHRSARRLSAATGRATSGWRMTPDFLIVGAQRCGTTSLYKTLVQHPDVLGAGLHKGVHYFDTAYERGPAWYRSHFPLEQRAVRAAHRTGVRPLTGEASPYYLFHPLAAERISRELPRARIVVLLRDPVERAYSAHTHERARGFETENFEEALALEESRLAGVEEQLRRCPTHVSQVHQHNAYLARGRYVDQLERLETFVGRDRLCVLDADDLFADVAEVLPGLLDFLGLRPWLPATFEQRNARPRSRLDADVRARLSEYFEPWDTRLAKWWDHTPSWRR